MKWFYWLIPLFGIAFLWRVNEWLNGRSKRQISGLLILAGLGICAFIIRTSEILFGAIAFFCFFLSAAFLHYPAEIVANLIRKITANFGR